LIQGLGHQFGKRRVLDSVSLAVEQGAFTVLLGRNGAGKTTLFSLATGLYHARSGSVHVFGNDMHGNPTAGLAAMGVVFQQPTLDLELTARENLLYHASLHGLPRALAAERAEQELARLGVSERRNDRVRALSGGQRRRVEIARALMIYPRLLLLDEPTTGLDIPGRKALLEHVRALCRSRSIAVLWATHFLDEVAAEDQIVVLHEGSLRWSGRAGQIAAELNVNSLPAAFAALTGAA
jgi:ABC-2 type transport system ATP-binding protein